MKKKSLWFYILKLVAVVFKVHVYYIQYELIVQEGSFNKEKITSKVNRYILAKNYSQARRRVRGNKHKTYSIQNIDIDLVG